MRNYIGLIHKDAESDYGVSFPDFPGAVAAGATLDEARRMAEEALAFHVEGLLEDGDTLPSPSSLETVMAASENREGVAILVSLKAASSKAVRINVTLPENILARIDSFPAAKGMFARLFWRAPQSTKSNATALRDLSRHGGGLTRRQSGVSNQ